MNDETSLPKVTEIFRELEPEQWRESDAREAKKMLHQGWWGWHRNRMDTIEEKTGHSEPKWSRPETVPLVSVANGKGSGTIWVFGHSSRRVDNLHTAQLEGRAETCWRDDVSQAVSQSLPALWTSLDGRHERLENRTRLSVSRLNCGGLDGSRATSADTLAGPSVGLSLALALVSHATNVQYPDDVVASATLDASGETGPVDRLSEKMALVEACTARIERFIVDAEQRDQAETLAEGTNLTVVPVDNLREAIEAVWKLRDDTSSTEVENDEMARRLLERSSDGPEEVARSLAQLTDNRVHTWDWSPVVRASNAALRLGEDELESTDIDDIQRARACATRYLGGRGEEALDDLPENVQPYINNHSEADWMNKLANLLQQSRDCGYPPVDEVVSLAEDSLDEPGTRGGNEELQAWGALAKVHAVRGRVEESLDLQKKLTQIWKRNFRPSEYQSDITHPLQAWFRLSGVLDHEASFEEADELYDDLRLELEEHEQSFAYVQWSRGRALAYLRRFEEARDVLVTLDERRGQLASHVAFSVQRWLIRLAEQLDDKFLTPDTRIESIEEEDFGDGSKSKDAAVNRYLIELDRMIDDESSTDRSPRAILDDLEDVKPYPTRHLLETARSKGCAPARYIRRHYPY